MIYVGSRSFDTVSDLIKSGQNSGLMQEMLGDFFAWWAGCRVRWNECNSSSAMVEVEGKRLLVGYPAYYKTFYFDSSIEALTTADKVAQKWAESNQDWREFVDSVSV